MHGTKGTLERINSNKKLGEMPDDIYRPHIAGDVFEIGDIRIKCTSVSHDANDPVAYTFSSGTKSAGILTDLGYYTDEIIRDFNNLGTLLVESNHDVNMLLSGPYPYMLKQRILGAKGHLSNTDCGALLGKIIGSRTSNIFLGHLSKENNCPELAYETVRLEINTGENEFKADDFNIQVADRNAPSDIITI